MPYCSDDDLLLTADVMVSPAEKTRFIRLTSEAMDAKLGYLYSVPINLDALPPHQKLLLKTINAKMATGRMLMSSSVGSQNTEVNAYAAYLIREAEMDLASIANGQVDLNAPRVDEAGDGVGVVADPTVEDPFARIPGGWNPDQTSAVTTFEKNYMTETTEQIKFTPADNILGEGRSTRIR